MHPNLSFEQAPPLSVPFRHFLTAPWLGVLAGLIIAWTGPDGFESRWTSATLAVTHLLTAGLMLQAMAGALLQFVPVAAGGNVWRPRFIAAITHPALLVGVLLLAAAFLAAPSLFRPAIAFIGLGIATLVAAVGWAILRTPAEGPTIVAMRIAVPALAVTAVLGALLAEGLGAGRGWPLLEMADVHAAWGLGGWGLVLLAGVSYYVVPMFQLTPPYPKRVAYAVPALLVAILTLWSFRLAQVQDGIQFVMLAGYLVAAGFGGATLNLQRRRRRKVSDPTLLFFRCAMGSLIALFGTSVVFLAVPTLGGEPRAPMWLGILALVGVFVSAISGMLYKIIPFISWLNLQGAYAPAPAPNMREIIPEKPMRRQMHAHFVAFAALMAAVVWPALTRPAGVLFAFSCGWLGWNVLCGIRNFSRFRDRRPQAGARSSL